MNIVAVNQENTLVISESTKELIQAGVSYNTLRALRVGTAKTRRMAIHCGQSGRINRCGACRVYHASP